MALTENDCTWLGCSEPKEGGSPLVFTMKPHKKEYFCKKHKERALKLGWEEVKE